MSDEGVGDAGLTPGGSDPDSGPPVERDAFDQAARVMYAVLLTIEGLWLADVITKGAVSRAIEPHLYRARTKLAGWLTTMHHDRELSDAGREVVVEAMTILHDHNHDQGA